MPEHRDSWRPLDRDALRAARALDRETGGEGAAAVQAWWQAQQDNAYAALPIKRTVPSPSPHPPRPPGVFSWRLLVGPWAVHGRWIWSHGAPSATFMATFQT